MVDWFLNIESTTVLIPGIVHCLLKKFQHDLIGIKNDVF